MNILEIGVILTITSLLSFAAFSSYETWAHHKIMVETEQELIDALTFAKNTSIISGEKISLCTSTDHQNCNTSWQGDLFIFSAGSGDKIGTPLQTFPAIPADIQIVSDSFRHGALYFMDNGEVSNNSSITLSHNEDTQTLTITLSKTGIVSTRP
jgi:Tfp pilus assembly protein FimT